MDERLVTAFQKIDGVSAKLSPEFILQTFNARKISLDRSEALIF